MNLDKEALELAVAGFFQHNQNSMPLQCPENRAEKYSVREGFGGTTPYWVDDVRGARFAETLTSGILYRPQIVNEICHQIENALNSPVKEGVMIKGPQGIGKSHSLVNTVLKLQSTGEFLVTFLPDCDSWETTTYLVNAICASFGTSSGQLGIEGLRFSAEDLEALISTIDIQLASLGKKWVFVFDQINKLFVKAINRDAKNASGLAFPFNMITQVRKRGRITSVISASANNEMAYKEHHEGFAEYIHRTSMTTVELGLAFDQIDETNVGNVVDATGGVPLYAVSYAKNPAAFQQDIDESVLFSLESLRPKNEFELAQWKLVQESIFSSIFGTTSSAARYDMKFLVREKADTDGVEWRYYPLFPAVLVAYRKNLWDELMKFVEEKESRLLDICRSGDTTNDTRGRLFELMVIRRCESSGVRIQTRDRLLDIGAGTQRFGGKLLPPLDATSPNRVFVPFDPNFPAIDLIWKHDRSVFGVQVHVTSHDDVAPHFLGLCRQAGWFKNFDAVHLLYLCPEDAVIDLVRSLVEPPTYEPRSTRDAPAPCRIERRAVSKNSVSCLKSLQWPDRCSL